MEFYNKIPSILDILKPSWFLIYLPIILIELGQLLRVYLRNLITLYQDRLYQPFCLTLI